MVKRIIRTAEPKTLRNTQVPALRRFYQEWLEKRSMAVQDDLLFTLPSEAREHLHSQGRTGAPGLGAVAIVGAGMAGLRVAMKLQSLSNTQITLFEADSRVGMVCCSTSDHTDFTRSRSSCYPALQQVPLMALFSTIACHARAGGRLFSHHFHADSDVYFEVRSSSANLLAFYFSLIIGCWSAWQQ